MKKSNFTPLFKFTLLIALTFSLSSMLASEPRFYQVELIFFEHLNQSPSPEGEQRIAESADYLSLRQFNLAKNEQLVMTDEASKIRGSRNFRLLKHFGWQQQGLAKNEAGAIRIGRWVPGINGTVTMYLGRYLHLDFHVQKTLTASTEPDSITIPLKERRRLRSNETHYIDHPDFGILARITPVDPPTTDN
ncbi:MAG: hypothetical protein HKN88_00150 [Gammaproteobacteria bacterium]|nr:peptidoglycan binding protein CsiV [Gammaproteobacteria bacterium]NNC96460.1 hypothetical protein [Gammaproteobacteria bacterium]NNM14509.1 hypothetical protein [Gammaproteobacteria bacterium]